MKHWAVANAHHAVAFPSGHHSATLLKCKEGYDWCNMHAPPLEIEAKKWLYILSQREFELRVSVTVWAQPRAGLSSKAKKAFQTPPPWHGAEFGTSAQPGQLSESVESFISYIRAFWSLAGEHSNVNTLLTSDAYTYFLHTVTIRDFSMVVVIWMSVCAAIPFFAQRTASDGPQ